jgi:hypothetical protein
MGLVSRKTNEAEQLFKELADRDFSKVDIVAVGVTGIDLRAYHVIRAEGV